MRYSFNQEVDFVPETIFIGSAVKICMVVSCGNSQKNFLREKTAIKRNKASFLSFHQSRGRFRPAEYHHPIRLEILHKYSGKHFL